MERGEPWVFFQSVLHHAFIFAKARPRGRARESLALARYLGLLFNPPRITT
jgi:hypothetical protein